MIEVVCRKCSQGFRVKPSWIKNGYGKYCSPACRHAASLKGRMIPCDTCNKTVYKSPKALHGSKSGKFFCNKTCQTKWRNSEFSQEKHPNWKSGKHTYRRLMRQSDIPKKCTLCKILDERVLAVHHIDEDRNNNTIENLAWLCHNCHHLVHHYPDEHKNFMAAIV